MPVAGALPPSAYRLFVGVDIAAATFTAVWMAPSASPSRPLTLDQTPQGFATLQARLLAAGHAPGEVLVVIHPYREKCKRRIARIGGKGLSTHRWIVGGKLGAVLNKWGLMCAWKAATANVHDSAFLPLVTRFAKDMVVFADGNCTRKVGNPPNLTVCPRGVWNDRMLVETTLTLCSPWSATPRKPPIASGATSPCAWLSPLLCSIHALNGRASSSMSTAAPIAPSPGSAYDTSTKG